VSTDTLPRWREAIVAIGLALAALIHLAPLPGLLGADMLERLYGLRIDDPSLLLLLRHRALLFGLLGTVLLVAIFRRAWRAPALLLGLASAGAFLLLAPDGLGPALQRVLWADAVAVAASAAALLAQAPWRR
jgi:hypothetical protein